jgi:EmrB/QacA subfamily drug resistance transporter
MLLTFRVFQGVAAGPMIPLSQTLLLSIYPPARKGMALALWSMTTLLAPIVGPLLGGWITDNISWPWIFYINIPVGLVAAWLTHGLLKSRETATRRSPVDAVSLMLLILGVGALQLMLDQGRELDWFNSRAIMLLAVLAGITLPYLIVRELGSEHPLVDLRLFSRRTFTVGAIALSLGYGVYFGNFVLVPLWLQTQLGYTATWAGMALAPTGILAVLLSPLVGRHLKRFDLRLGASFAFVVFALCAFWRAGFTTGLDFGHLALVQSAQGIGTAVFFVALVTILLSGLPPERIASAAGLSNFLRITAGSFAASLTTTWWHRRQALHQTELSSYVHPYNPVALDALGQRPGLHACRKRPVLVAGMVVPGTGAGRMVSPHGAGVSRAYIPKAHPGPALHYIDRSIENGTTQHQSVEVAGQFNGVAGCRGYRRAARPLLFGTGGDRCRRPGGTSRRHARADHAGAGQYRNGIASGGIPDVRCGTAELLRHGRRGLLCCL